MNKFNSYFFSSFLGEVRSIGSTLTHHSLTAWEEVKDKSLNHFFPKSRVEAMNERKQTSEHPLDPQCETLDNYPGQRHGDPEWEEPPKSDSVSPQSEQHS